MSIRSRAVQSGQIAAAWRETKTVDLAGFNTSNFTVLFSGKPCITQVMKQGLDQLQRGLDPRRSFLGLFLKDDQTMQLKENDQIRVRESDGSFNYYRVVRGADVRAMSPHQHHVEVELEWDSDATAGGTIS